MKEKLSKGFLIFLAVLFVGYFLFTGISDLTNKKDLHEVHVDGAFEILEVQHSINGLIPAGKGHYYVGIDEESYNAYIIHAPKGWYGKRFDSSGLAVDSNGVSIIALSKGIGDHEIARELASHAGEIEGVTYPLGAGYTLEISYKRNAILKLVILVLIAILVVVGMKMGNGLQNVSKPVKTIYIVVVFIVMLLVLVVLR